MLNDDTTCVCDILLDTVGDICLTPWDVESRRIHMEDGIWPTLYGGSGGGRGYVMSLDGRKYVIRRLTPVETERLQGFPDGHTDLTNCDIDVITDRVAKALGYDDAEKKALRRRITRWSKGTSDSPRYKATGNSFAIPVVRWIGEQIEKVDSLVNETDTRS